MDTSIMRKAIGGKCGCENCKVKGPADSTKIAKKGKK
jgi:hypothetical protein